MANPDVFVKCGSEVICVPCMYGYHADCMPMHLGMIDNVHCIEHDLPVSCKCKCTKLGIGEWEKRYGYIADLAPSMDEAEQMLDELNGREK